MIQDRIQRLAGINEVSDREIENQIYRQIDRLQNCSNEDEALKLIWGWIKQGDLTLKQFKVLLQKNPYKHKL